MALWVSSSSDDLFSSLSSSVSIVSSISPYSPVVTYSTSPVFTKKYNLVNTLYPLYANAMVDEDHNSNYFTQRQMTKYFLYTRVKNRTPL